MVDYDVAVIGAGVSGLAALKSFLDKNLSVICLEKSDDIGGLWNFSENGCGVMRFTHSNVSKQNFVFSDFPFPEEVPDFPHQTEIMKYLRDYSEHFNLMKHIALNCIVVSVRRLTDNQWKITFDKGRYDNREGLQTVTVRNVAIATGHHSNPYIPKIPGEETYMGTMYHSVKYKCAATSGIEPGKRVLVVGMGNSAVDIADNMVTEGRCQVDISARSPAWIFPPYLMGLPLDHFSVRALYSLLPLDFVEKVVQTLVCIVSGLPKNWGVYPMTSILRSQATVSHTLYHHIQRKKILMRHDISSLGPGKRVTFTDGSLGWYDGIILATGYTFTLPILSKNDREHIMPGVNELNLYKNVFSPRFGHTLGLIGFVEPAGSGGGVCMSEMQSRWMAELVCGSVHLPTPTEMQNSQLQDRSWEKSWYYNSKRNTILKIPVLYTDEIAEMIGVKPVLSKNPLLAWKLLFTTSAFQWRLNGPNSWSGARDICKKIKPAPVLHYSGLVLVAILFFIVLGFMRSLLRLVSLVLT